MNTMRRGFTTLDAIAGIVVALALAAIVSQAIVSTAQQGRFLEQRRVALEEVASAMEQARSLPWTELTAERLKAIPLSPLAEQMLAAGKLSFQLDEVAGPPLARKVTAEITWKIGVDETTSPMRFVVWRYAPRGATP